MSAGETPRRLRAEGPPLLRDEGVIVEMQTIERPGRVVYEDAHQLAVVPWSDAKPL